MSRNTRPYTVDSTDHSAVAVCSIDGCLYRGATNTRANAMRMLARHLERCHPDTRKYRQDLRQQADRAVSRSADRRRGK